MKRSLLVFPLLGSLMILPACAAKEADDTDGDADSDTDGDSDTDSEDVCETVEDTPTCDADGLDAAPEEVEPGCQISRATVEMAFLLNDEGQRDPPSQLGEPRVALTVTPRELATFPLDSDLSAFVNGCPIPPVEVPDFKWQADGDDVTIVLGAGKYYVFEVRENGTPSRLFYRQAFQMPEVAPQILTPGVREDLPDDDRYRVTVTWEPYDLGLPWVSASNTTLRGWFVGAMPDDVLEIASLDSVDATSGSAQFTVRGAADSWRWIEMESAMFQQSDVAVTLTVVRRVN